MRKKARYSLIIGVVLIIILGLGFGVWKIFFAPKSLKIRDLENMRITIQRHPETGDHTFWMLPLWNSEGSYISTNDTLGYVDDFKGGNVYYDGLALPCLQQVRIAVFVDEGPVLIEAGDTLEITFDGGKSLTAYFPEMRSEGLLYVATDGSTYYNERLTKLAQKAPVPSKEERQ